MQRVYTEEKLAGNSAILNDPEIVQRLNKVLRLKKGGQFYLFNSTDLEYLVEITDISAKKISIALMNKIERQTQPKRILNLYPSLFKKQRFEWMLEKCTEIGVKTFNPVISEHAIIKEFVLKSSEENKRWKKILISAAEQSEHSFIPKINIVQSLDQALTQAKENIYVAAERTESIEQNFIVDESFFKTVEDTINLFIGPEGGWSAAELQLFKKHGAKFVNFGKNILRSETACIVGSAVALL